MSKVAVVTDSNAGMSQRDAEENGIYVVPMPFTINGTDYLEGINLSQKEFYAKLADGADVSTSMPSLGGIADLFTDLLKSHDEIVYVPMSSSLSSSCASAKAYFEDPDNGFAGKVEIVDNRRISVTQRQSVLDAKKMTEMGKNAREIRKILEKDGLNCSIYIMMDTLHYLKKGGRITPAAAAIGTILRIKPVLQINGEKLDAFAKARTSGHGKQIMLNAIHEDAFKRFGPLTPENVMIAAAYTYDEEAAAKWQKEIEAEFPGMVVRTDPLSLSVSCHIGPGALAVTITKRMRFDENDAYIEPAENEVRSEKEIKKAKALTEKEELRKKKFASRQEKRREKEAWKDQKKNG